VTVVSTADGSHHNTFPNFHCTKPPEVFEFRSLLLYNVRQGSIPITAAEGVFMSSVKSGVNSRLRMPQIKLTRYEVAISMLQTSGLIAILTFIVMLVIEAPNENRDRNTSGVPGSADGTGGRPLGSGGPGRGGAKREQGWIVEFADKGDLDSYAAQLDFFGIELGLLQKEEARLTYLSNVSRPVPTKREVRTGDAEKRLFLKWQDGSQDRIKADMELFQRAGIDGSSGVILHFYPAATEQMLAQLEVAYGNQQPTAIRRTYFRVRKAGSGYEFVVDRQVLK